MWFGVKCTKWEKDYDLHGVFVLLEEIQSLYLKRFVKHAGKTYRKWPRFLPFDHFQFSKLTTKQH